MGWRRERESQRERERGGGGTEKKADKAHRHSGEKIHLRPER